MGNITTSTEAVTALLEGVTEGPWGAHNMINQDTGKTMTPEEMGEYVCNSMKMGDLSRFLFISGKHDDGGDCDIAHIGNGPLGPHNARFISASRDLVPALVLERDELKAKLSKAINEMKKVDEYLTRLQTPNTEPLNSVNCSGNKLDRGYYTAMVRNEAREYWASLGNTIAELTGGKDET